MQCTALKQPLCRAAVVMALLALVGGCGSDEGTAVGAPGLGSMAVQPVLPPNFSRFAGELAVEQVHVLVERPRLSGSNEILSDVTAPFALSTNTLQLNLPVLLIADTELLLVGIDYLTASGLKLFSGKGTVLVAAGSTPNAVPKIPIAYVGPGANTSTVTVTPSDTVLPFGGNADLRLDAYDAAGLPVPNVYVHWSTDDPAVPIDALGHLQAPGVTKQVRVIAETPVGVADTTMVFISNGAIAVLPDSMELLLQATQSFMAITSNRSVILNWSVNGVLGGNTLIGTIDPQSGFYTAPSAAPSPSTVTVCAEVQSSPTERGCASVTLVVTPTPSGDIAAFSDTYIFTNGGLANPTNRAVVRQLVNYTAAAPRAAGTRIVFDRGRGSTCFVSGVCQDTSLAAMVATIQSAGYTVQKVDTTATIGVIPADVKVIFLWNPQQYYGFDEANALRRFAEEGGRVVLVADDTTSYGGGLSGGLSVAGNLMYQLGTGIYFSVQDVVCAPPFIDLGSNAIAPHQITTGLAGLRVSCGSAISVLPKDYPLVTDPQTLTLLGAVSKVDPTPQVAQGVAVRR